LTIFVIYILALVLPAIGGLLNYLLKSKKAILPLSIGGILPTLVLVITAAVDLQKDFYHRFLWLSELEMGWHLDALSLVLVALVLFVSLLVQIFSAYYMADDREIYRFYFKLGFFTSAMIGLLGADHFFLLFIFWELVGFFSYLLIGFWFKDREKADAARNAFITNRIADLCLIVGIFCFWIGTDTLFISEIFISEGFWSTAGAIGILIGAMGKSAQFPFHTWLPKAMAGPTPVSALIHAATMVAVGVYLLVRMQPYMPNEVLTIVAVVGAFTALLAAFFALTQFDIKKILAYSTISQLGYMVMAVGVGSREMAFFHLWTHAFFKAGLFLTAGIVIHQLSHHFQSIRDPQDMRNMGGLRKMLPVTFWTFTVCMLALIGLPLFTGFFSKDGILIAAFAWAANQSSSLAWIIPTMGLFTAFLTAYYMIRQWKMVFFGMEERSKHQEPILARIPVMIFALGSLWIWYSWNPTGHSFQFLRYVFPDILIHNEFGFLVPVISVGFIILGVFVGWRKEHGHFYPNHLVINLSFNGFFLDRVYQQILITPYNKISSASAFIDKRILDPALNGLATSTVVFSHLLHFFEKHIIDGLVNFAAYLSRTLGSILKRQQSFSWQQQIIWLLLIIILVFYYLFRQL